MKGWISNARGMGGLQFGELADPIAKAGEIIVEVRAAALNFSDILMIDDAYQVKPPRPFTPGQEVAGVVVSAPELSRWRPGDRVATKVNWGGFAERVAVPADMPIALPDAIGFARAAAIPVSYTTAIVALSECSTVRPGATVLVHAAAGAVGLAAVQYAAANGATVIATAGSDEKARFCEELGAERGINYHDEDFVTILKAEGGADLILDMVGGPYLPRNIKALADDGRLVQIAFLQGPKVELNFAEVMMRRLTITGSTLRPQSDQAKAAIAREVETHVWPMIARGALRVVIDSTFALTEAPAAHWRLESSGHIGKIVLRVGAGG